jgi:O-antigen/teichoic acid export membrane protein
LSSITGIPNALLYTVAVYAIFNTVVEVLLAIWRMENKATFYGVFRVSRTVVEIALVIFYVIGCRLNFEGSIYAMLISYGVATIVAVFILYRKGLLFGVFRAEYLKHALNYGVPLIPHTLSATAIMYADKLILTHYNGLSSNGVYSVGFMVGQVIGLLQNSFNQAWVPWVFQKLKAGKESDKLRMVKITYLYFAGIFITVFVLWLMIPFIYSFLGKAFQAGMELVLWIALGFAFNGMYKMVGVYMFYFERTGMIALTSIGAAVVNISLSFVLIPVYGEHGAAYSSMISMISLFLVTWFISARLIKMPWNLKKHG